MAASKGKGKVTFGVKGVSVRPEDIFYSAIGHTICIDSVAIERLQQQEITTPLISSLPPAPTAKEGSDILAEEHARAALSVCTARLVQSKPGVRASVPAFFTNLLNERLELKLPSVSGKDAPILRSIAEAAIGLAADSKAPGLTKTEGAALSGDILASIGIAAVCSQLAANLPSLADAVAALSCESLQANILAFDSVNLEGCPHKSQVKVASDLRLLLATSKLVNPRKGAVDAPCISSVPEIHGPLHDAVRTLLQVIRGELVRVTEAPASSAAAGKVECTAEEGAKGKETVEGGGGKGKEKGGGGNKGKEKGEGGVKGKKGKKDEAAMENGVECLGASTGDGEVMAGVKSSPMLANSLMVLLRALGPLAACSRKRTLLNVNAIGGLAKEARADSSVSDGSVSKLVDRIRSLERKAFDALADSDIHEFDGLPGVLVSVAACEAVDATLEILLNEVAVSLELLRLRGVGSAAGQAGGKSKGLTLGKGTAILLKYLEESTSTRPEDVLGALHKALSPRDESVGALLEALKGVLESNDTRRLCKIPKGTKDILPDQMAIRERAFAIITGAFKRHGAVALETPVFELRETLTGKYGEDSKLIYDLADQGGESLSLRYDLTVPFARFVAMYGFGSIKRYHIARVYRRDQPHMSRGRYREFYQCDFDIAGIYAAMAADAEVLKVLTEILDELQIGEYEVKLNHRGLLDSMMDICGVPGSKFRSICSAIDKLDKEPWEAVRTEMVEDRGLPPEVADKIGTFVCLRGEPLELIEKLTAAGSQFSGHSGAKLALDDMVLLFKYLQAMGCLSRFVFDLSLARGLDYYTGMIFEAVFKGTSQVGSISGGGRYDNLVGMFSGKKIPSVGMSVGIERVFSIMENIERSRSAKIRTTQTEVLVASLGPEMLKARMEVCAELWSANIKAEFIPKASLNFNKQVSFGLDQGIPWMVIFGEDELARGEVQIKQLTADASESDTPLVVPRERLVEELRSRIGTTSGPAPPITKTLHPLVGGTVAPTTSCMCLSCDCNSL